MAILLFLHSSCEVMVDVMRHELKENCAHE
jgi:hypothetical protein